LFINQLKNKVCVGLASLTHTLFFAIVFVLIQARYPPVDVSFPIRALPERPGKHKDHGSDYQQAYQYIHFSSKLFRALIVILSFSQ
jgi:hypothetical protein